MSNELPVIDLTQKPKQSWGTNEILSIVVVIWFVALACAHITAAIRTQPSQGESVIERTFIANASLQIEAKPSTNKKSEDAELSRVYLHKAADVLELPYKPGDYLLDAGGSSRPRREDRFRRALMLGIGTDVDYFTTRYIFWAVLLGAISAVSLPLGSALGRLTKPRSITMSVLAAFGAGALIGGIHGL